MTTARIQPFCKAQTFIIKYFDGIRVFPRSVFDGNNAVYLHNNHFCLIWKSEGVSFNQAIKKVKDKVKIVDNYITEESVNCQFKYEFIPKKIESRLNNFIVEDLETHNTDKRRPHNMTFYRLSKLAGRYNRELTPLEIEKCKNYTVSI